jgi:hypothetical protein
MKNSKILSLLAATLLTTAVTIKADENVPTVIDGEMDLEQYLFGDVDSNGQTMLHRIAGNCDNNNFTVHLKLFDFVENCGKPERTQALQQKMALYSLISNLAPDKDIASLAILMDMNDFVQKKDNNGETALDLAKKRNALNPQKQCGFCIEALEVFEKLNEKMNKEVKVIKE